jgi:hypothetical protein
MAAVSTMGKDLLRRMANVGTEGGPDVKVLLRQFLEEKCHADDRACALAFLGWLAATLVFAMAVALLILGEGVKDVPGLGGFPVVPDAHLQAIAGACAVVSSLLFMIFLKLRQEQTKHTFLLFMVAQGDVRDAAALLLGHREGRAGAVLDAADTVFLGMG